MFTRLGRWLRAAGYDTLIIDYPFSDRNIAALALKERRFLVTRDRHFFDYPEVSDRLIWLKANSVEDCVKELSTQLPLNWTLAPFSRCLLCNQQLVSTTSKGLALAPKEIRKRFHTFWLCCHCGKIYWQGSHTKKMLEALRSWNQIATHD